MWYSGIGMNTTRDFSKPGVIYVVTDSREPDRVRYVGRTIQPLRFRIRSHWYEAMRKRGKFQNWLRSRDGRREDVVFTVVSHHEDGHDLNRAEVDTIALYRKLGQADMNLTDGGDGRLGYKLSEEQAEKHRLGVPRGEKQWQSKLTWEQVHEIRDLRQREHIKDSVLADRYGVSRSSISSVLKNDLWFDPEFNPETVVWGSRTGDNARNRKITFEDVSRMRRERSEQYETNSNTGVRYGITGDMVYRILKNLNWFDPEFDPTSILQRNSK